MYLSDDDLAGLPQKVVAWVKSVEAWHARHIAEHQQAELEVTPLPSVFGGIDPFLTPLPSDGPQALGQLYNLCVYLNGEVTALRQSHKEIKSELGYKAYRARIKDL